MRKHFPFSASNVLKRRGRVRIHHVQRNNSKDSANYSAESYPSGSVDNSGGDQNLLLLLTGAL